MGLSQKLRFVGGIVLAGVDLWVSPPRVKEARIAQAPRDKLKWRTQSMMQGSGPKRFREYRLTIPVEGISDGYECGLSIDTVRNRIDWRGTDSSLFRKEHQGSGMIGVMLFSLPSSLLLSPYILLMMRKYASQEEQIGMSRHAIALLKAIEGQLPSEEVEALASAFRSEWAAERRMLQKPTAQEAATLLETLEQVYHVVSREEIEEYGGEAGTELNWYDASGDRLATGFVTPDGACTVSVLSANFDGADAERLSKRYLNRREIHADDPEE